MTTDEGPRIAWNKMHVLLGQVLRDMLMGALIVWLMGGITATRAVVGVALLDGLVQLTTAVAIVSWRRRQFARAPKPPAHHCDVCPSENVRVVHLVLCEDDARALSAWMKSTAARPQLLP